MQVAYSGAKLAVRFICDFLFEARANLRNTPPPPSPTVSFKVQDGGKALVPNIIVRRLLLQVWGGKHRKLARRRRALWERSQPRPQGFFL